MISRPRRCPLPVSLCATEHLHQARHCTANMDGPTCDVRLSEGEEEDLTASHQMQEAGSASLSESASARYLLSTNVVLPVPPERP